MATLNHGILTDAGRNLFNSVIKGDSKITYTKVVFCDDKELLNMSDDEIQDLTQINVNNSLETQPVSYDEGLLQGQNGEQASEVVVRAIVSNAGNKDDSGNVIQPPLTNGFYPYVSALYASDGTNEILYGLYLKDQPGYMPAYDGHTPQPLQFTWRLYAATTDNFNLSDTNDVYATMADLQELEQNYNNFTNRANKLLNGSMTNPITVQNGTDLNDLTTSGCYSLFWKNDIKNRPRNDMSGSLTVMNDSNGGDVFQTVNYPNGQHYYRSQTNGGKWSAWTSSIDDLNTRINHVQSSVPSLQGTMTNPIIIQDGTDLNTLTTSGCYSMFWKNDIKNRPRNDMSGSLTVMNDANGGDVFQTASYPDGSNYSRSEFHGNWKPWKSNKDAISAGTMINPINLESGTDLNNLTISGCYVMFWRNDIKNRPINNLSGSLTIMNDEAGGDIFQTASYPSGQNFYRSRNPSGEWSDWYSIKNNLQQSIKNSFNQAEADTAQKVSSLQSSFSSKSLSNPQNLYNTDVNTVTSPGYYSATWTWRNTNTPIKASFILRVMKDSGGDLFQKFISPMGCYFRWGENANNWQSWQEIKMS